MCCLARAIRPGFPEHLRSVAGDERASSKNHCGGPLGAQVGSEGGPWGHRPEARGTGAGRALVEGLVALGKEQGWRRVYWHTHENNYGARMLSDRLIPRTDYVRYDIDL